MHFTVQKGFFRKRVLYSCPACKAELENKFKMAGKEDACPICGKKHICPGEFRAEKVSEKPKKSKFLETFITFTAGLKNPDILIGKSIQDRILGKIEEDNKMREAFFANRPQTQATKQRVLPAQRPIEQDSKKLQMEALERLIRKRIIDKWLPIVCHDLCIPIPKIDITSEAIPSIYDGMDTIGSCQYYRDVYRYDGFATITIKAVLGVKEQDYVSTLAHECRHAWQFRYHVPPTEKDCNDYAAEFLTRFKEHLGDQ